MLYGGRVEAIRAALTESSDGFVAKLAAEFEAASGAPPKPQERRSWQRSWPALLKALVGAGLGELWMALEFGLPRTGERVDALLIGRRPDGKLVTVVVELKQWTKADVAVGSGLWVHVGQRVVTHPGRQVAGYEHYLRNWVDPGDDEFEVRGIAVLHDAEAPLIDKLRSSAADASESAAVPLLGIADLRGTAEEIASRLGCADLTEPTDADVEWFLGLPHRPSAALFDELGRVLDSDSRFRLIGRQQDAYVALLEAVGAAARLGERRVLAVRGGPGTGKSVIAARLVAGLPRYLRSADIECATQYLTPTKTLRRQLARAATDDAGKGLFGFVDLWKPSEDKVNVVLIDEAQRVTKPRANLVDIMEKAAVTVVFFDERQVIRPGEGFSLQDLDKFAYTAGATRRPVLVDLEAQFRCGGSQRYQNWLGSVLSTTGTPSTWRTDGDYDFAVAEDPEVLQSWLDKQSASGHRARMSAGFCWPWTRTGPKETLKKDVVVHWTGSDKVERTWRRPWNADVTVLDDKERAVAPESVFWATDSGGEGQVGCVYTAQALEYEFGGVIMGKDLVRRGGRWVADPNESKDPKMKKARLTPEEYLPLALNIYWVLLTRASRGCRVYSDDEDTQKFLHSLVQSKTRARA